MTKGELLKACRANRYILVTYECNGRIFRFGINCKIADIALNKKAIDFSEESKYLGFRPCSFMQYISNKTPFIKKDNE